MKKKYFKTIGSILIVGAFLFLALASDPPKSSSGNSNSSSSNSSDLHICSTCGKKYEGKGYSVVSDGVGGDFNLQQGDIYTDCIDCAQKDKIRMEEARLHGPIQPKRNY